MNRQTIPYLILAAALIASIAQAVIYFPRLPETVASHFDGNGAANGWMSRGAFVAIMLVVQFGTAIFMIGLGNLLKLVPDSMINIPNREYWLAEERREETLRDNRSTLIWVTAATGVFFLLVFQMTIDANLNQANGINSVLFWIALVGYLGIIFTLTLRMTIKYKRLPGDSKTG